MKYIVEIIEMGTQRVLKEMKPQNSQRRAEKLEWGVNINLDHNRCYTQIREVETAVVNLAISQPIDHIRVTVEVGEEEE